MSAGRLGGLGLAVLGLVRWSGQLMIGLAGLCGLGLVVESGLLAHVSPSEPPDFDEQAAIDIRYDLRVLEVLTTQVLREERSVEEAGELWKERPEVSVTPGAPSVAAELPGVSGMSRPQRAFGQALAGVRQALALLLASLGLLFVAPGFVAILREQSLVFPVRRARALRTGLGFLFGLVVVGFVAAPEVYLLPTVAPGRWFGALDGFFAAGSASAFVGQVLFVSSFGGVLGLALTALSDASGPGVRFVTAVKGSTAFDIAFREAVLKAVPRWRVLTPLLVSAVVFCQLKLQLQTGESNGLGELVLHILSPAPSELRLRSALLLGASLLLLSQLGRRALLEAAWSLVPSMDRGRG